DTLGYQIDDIEREKPVLGEDEALEAELEVLRNAERIVMGAAGAFAALSDDEPSAAGLAADALRQLRAAGRHAPTLAALADELEAAVSALGAVATEVEAFLGTFEAEPGRLDAVQGRLAALDNLKRKYGPDLAAVKRFHDQALEERGSLEGLDAQVSALESESAALEAELADLARAVTDARSRAAPRLADALAPLLLRLGMPHAVFTVAVEPAPKRGPYGDDTVEFRFSANA